MDKDELKGITDTFKKFASYDDMRDLYNRCIPEISRFEDKLQQTKNEIAQFTNVILKFDESMLEKCSKKQHELLKKDVYTSFLQKIDVEEF
jgi:hypothetical protein